MASDKVMQRAMRTVAGIAVSIALCLSMQDGMGVPKDEAGAVGNRDAQALIGLAYKGGRPGRPRDEEKAVSWLQKAAAHGDANARAVLKQMGH
jgi:TPR repeat protein